MPFTGTLDPFSAGSKLTNARFLTWYNALKALSDPWTDYSGSFTWTNSTTNPVLNNGTLIAEYMQVGKFIVFRVNIVMGSTTTFGSGGGYSFGLPANSAEPTGQWNGGVTLNDSSATGNRQGRIAWQNAAATVGVADEATGARVSTTVPFTFASGDQISIKGIYEAA